jgi:hypothetical protein
MVLTAFTPYNSKDLAQQAQTYQPSYKQLHAVVLVPTSHVPGQVALMGIDLQGPQNACPILTSSRLK